MRVSIVIPAYNEEKRIGKMLEVYCEYFSRLKKQKILDFEILIVINGTTDNTEGVVKEYQKKFKEIIYMNRMDIAAKGLAIIEGFKDALKRNNDLIGFVDGDLATPPEAYYDLINQIGNHDGIIPIRWDKKSKILTEQSFFRKMLSAGYNLVVRGLFLFPYRDTQCGAKLFKREILEKNINKIVTSSWGFDIALLFCLRNESNAKIKSIPTTWEDKKGSKINFKRTPLRMFASAIRLRLIHSWFKDFVKLYRKLPEKMKFHQWN